MLFGILRELKENNDNDENVGNGKRRDKSRKRMNMTYAINIDCVLQKI